MSFKSSATTNRGNIVVETLNLVDCQCRLIPDPYIVFRIEHVLDIAVELQSWPTLD
jgi:hypothetical protein